MRLKDINTTSTFAWSHDTLPLVATGTVAGAVDANFSSQSQLQVWDIFGASDEPIFSAAVDSRFHALAWSAPLAGRARGVLVAAYEDGALEFYDVDALIKSHDLASARVHRSTRHSGAAKSLAFNPQQPHVLVSGGANGEIFIWDTTTFDEPTTPGKAMTPMDEVTSVAWNNAVSHIFATTSNGGYTSIWDLKSRREVLHLSYQGPAGKANFSHVAWHPTQSTKLVTASDADSCPLILTWDLRNSNEPETVMTGHQKGVLSVDWCLQDPNLLLSSGKDNATMLWNPVSGAKLGEYPTTANWAFLTKFAPKAPDVFATASFDGKISVQSLQDTSPPVSTKVKSNNDDEFWSELSTTDTQQPVFDIKQAPAWLQTPSSVSFGFGSKLVVVSKDANGKSVVNVSKFTTKRNLDGETTKFSQALDSNDFSTIIDEKLAANPEKLEKSDWELLKELSDSDNKTYFQKAIQDPKEANGEAAKEGNGNVEKPAETDESFFANLGSETTQKPKDLYTPSGAFRLYNKKSSAQEKKLIKLILGNKLETAIDECLSSDRLLEAFVLALDASEDYKDKVKNAYFTSSKNPQLARVLYSASSKDATDLVGNADVAHWKEIAKGITAYSSDPEDYNRKIVELGDRILASNESDSRDSAILCYLAGGALDKISNIWLKELPEYETKLLESTDNEKISSPSDARFEALNNFAAKISAYRAISKSTASFSGPSAEPLCKAIFEYSNMLAGFGQFDLADKFLKLLPDDFAGLKTDIDRITKASSVSHEPATKSYGSRAAKKTAVTSPYLPGAQLNSAPSKPSNPYLSGATSAPVNTFTPAGNSYAPPANAYAPAANAYAPPSGNAYAPPSGNAYAPPSGNAYAPPSGNAYAPPTPQGIAPPPANNFAAPANSFAQPPNAYAAPKSFTSPPVAPSNPYKPAGHSNPYAPSNPYMKNPVDTGANLMSPPPVGPPKPTYKQETEGWNDLPDTFKPKAPPRRAAQAAAVPSSPSSFSGPPRAGFVSPPPLPSPGLAGPPKGPSRAASKANLKAPAPPAPSTPTSPPAPSRYAPPAPPVQPANVSSPSAPPASLAAAKNPYAPTSSSHAAPKNPYAPPPGATPSFGSRNPSTSSGHAGVLPPPKAGIVAPPPMGSAPPAHGGIAPPHGGIVPPPHGGIVPPHGGIAPPPQPAPPAAQSAAALAAAAVPAPKYPPGDRSHIAGEAKVVFENLSSSYDLIKNIIPEKYAKHGVDMEKRLNILFDHLNNDDLLSPGGIDALKQISFKLKEKDYPSASGLTLDFASTFPEEIGMWHAGVKRLINMTEALQ